AGFGVLEQAAFIIPALLRPVRIGPAAAIPAQGGAGLGKAGDGSLPPRKRDGQAQPLQLLGVVRRTELDEVEKRSVAAQPARQAKVTGFFHALTIPIPSALENTFRLISPP